MIVQKYGGTSVGSPERVMAAAKRVAQSRAEGEDVVVVTSAMGGDTDRLLGLADSVAPGAARTSPREVDLLVATGEQVAAALLALALQELGVGAVALDGGQAEIRTSGEYGAARILEIRGQRIRQVLAEGCVPVVVGFQGRSDSGELTTLGRGGSDTTAVALAIALSAKRCDIYTDVDGIFTADPRKIQGAMAHDRLSHREALLLTLGGAAVLHSRAAALAGEHGFPLRVLSGLLSNPTGTRIQGEPMSEDGKLERPRVLGIAAASGATRLVIEEWKELAPPTAAVLSSLSAAGIPVELLDDHRANDGSRRLSTVVASERAFAAEAAIGQALGERARIRRSDPIGRITVVGTGLSACGSTLAAAVDRLVDTGIEPEGMGFTELGLTFYLLPELVDEAASLLHDFFFNGGNDDDGLAAMPPTLESLAGVGAGPGEELPNDAQRRPA